MDYKGRFLPQQRLAPTGWLRVDENSQSTGDAAG
jgi:arginine-tRNA-protein transferase